MIQELDLDFELEVGDVKVVREDKYNFAVQQLMETQCKQEGKRGGKYTGETRLGWKTVAFYGERPGDIICACKAAIAIGARGNDTCALIASVERAEQTIGASLGLILKEMKKNAKG